MVADTTELASVFEVGIPLTLGVTDHTHRRIKALGTPIFRRKGTSFCYVTSHKANKKDRNVNPSTKVKYVSQR
eukprot:scaffold16577_cov75-Skeletonema_marinoi.AAC.1